MGGRLDFMSGHEYAISALLEELPVVERYVASGGRLGEQDVLELRSIQTRIAGLLDAFSDKAATDPAVDDVPCPHWLQPLMQPEDEEANQPYPVRQSA
jgi:hypothetical protein